MEELHEKAKIVDSLSSSQTPVIGALLKSHAAALPAPLPVGLIGETFCHAKTEQEMVALARQWQKLQLRSEQVDRSNDQLAQSNTSRSGIDIEGLGTQLKALASGSTPSAGSLGASNRGGCLNQPRPGFSSAAIEAAVAEHWRLNPLLAAVSKEQKLWDALPSSAIPKGGAVGSDSKGQKGRSLKPSMPQNGKSGYSHAAAWNCSPPVLPAPPGTWAMHGGPPRPWFFVGEAPRNRDAVRSPKDAESGSQAPANGYHRDQASERGGRVVAHPRRTAPTSNLGGNVILDRKAENAETVQRSSKGHSATNVPSTGLKRPSKGREKQSNPIARKDDFQLKMSFKRCKFLTMEQGVNSLLFELRNEDLQERLHPEETLEGEPLCAEDEALAASSPWDYGDLRPLED